MLGDHEFRARGVLTRCPVIVVNNNYGCALDNDNVGCLAVCVKLFVVNVNRAARIDATSVHDIDNNININIGATSDNNIDDNIINDTSTDDIV